jgi:hypothetical protein
MKNRCDNYLSLNPLLASLQRCIARQEARLLWLKERDAPIKFFHIHVNARRRHKHIHSLQHDGQVVVAENQKDQVAFNFFRRSLEHL